MRIVTISIPGLRRLLTLILSIGLPAVHAATSGSTGKACQILKQLSGTPGGIDLNQPAL